MAFDTLGINVTASGIAGVARQVGHLANSFAKYINTVERTDRASMRAATSTALLADALSGKAQRAVDSFARSIPAAQKQLTNLTNKILVLQLRLASSANAQINYVNATKQLQAATAALGAQTASLPTLMAREANALLKVQSATLAVVAAQNKLDANTDPKAVGGLTANLNKKIRELDRLKIAYNNAKAAVIAYKAAEATFERAEKDWQRAARALATYKTQYNALTQAQKDGADVQKKLNQLIKDEADARAHAQDMSDNAADSLVCQVNLSAQNYQSIYAYSL